jgi:N-methylhydantoinase B
VKGLFAPFDVGNEGHIMAVDFDVPPGMLVSPERPAPVDSYGYVGVALIELVIRALAPVMPAAVPASGYQISGVDLSRVDPRDGEPFVFTDIHDGGAGARPDRDGPVLIFAGDGDTRNVPVEVIETRYPLRVERHELLPDLAGAGRFRGGAGVARDFRMLEDGIRMQYTNENVTDALAKGIAGGADGAPGSVVVHPGSEREVVLRDRISHYGPFRAGDLISVRSGGGGGLGEPFERDPEQVAFDVLDDVLDAVEAARVYGVVVTEAGGVDLEATDRLRSAKGSEPR